MDIQHSVSEVHSSELQRDVSGNSVVYTLPDNWNTFICTPTNVKMVWDKFNQFPILFDDMVRGNFERFFQELADPNSIVLATGTYGLVRVCNIVPERNADIHLTFWDRRFKGRDKECKQALRWLFQTMNLTRVTVTLPAVVFATITFTEALGFRREGVIRKAWMYKGELLDLHIFGMLKHDAMKEEV